MPITTSYFAVCKHVEGTKSSVARFHDPRITGSLDERLLSFAPSVELLKEYKKGKMEWSDYKRKYTEEQRRHYREAPQDFEGLLERAKNEEIVLLCYERFEGPKTHCHRFLLYDMLKKVADKKKMKVEFKDETPYQKAAKKK